ncbi:MAG: helix-turn-helix domain-containing protein [Pseudomonadales bacterium]|nr:helix-turn-helix domain-containing protein [Pseudomonadales bacterium]
MVKSAERVFEVLELFRRERKELSGAQIGNALHYPKSSTNVLMKSLVKLGYFVIDPATLRYFPSLSVTQLGDWIPSSVLAGVDARGVLASVHAATRETVTLSVQNDLHCRFIRVIPGTFPISLRLTEGFVAPLFTTAVGTAIVSQLADDEVAELVKRANQRADRGGERLELATVLRTATEVRHRGYALFYDSLFPDTGAIGVPFPAQTKSFPMAIGVGGLRHRIRRNASAIFRAVQTGLAHATRESTSHANQSAAIASWTHNRRLY